MKTLQIALLQQSPVHTQYLPVPATIFPRCTVQPALTPMVTITIIVRANAALCCNDRSIVVGWK